MQNQHTPWHSYWQDSSFDTFGKTFFHGNPIADLLYKEIKGITLCNQNIECVLDLGSGRGEHFTWLREALSQKEMQSFEIVGADAAVDSMVLNSGDIIVSDNFETLKKTKLLDKQFSLAFALFAAEYGQFSKVLAALKDTTNSPLDCIFMMHTESSVITQKTRHTLDFYNLLLNKDNEKAIRKLAKSLKIKQFEESILTNISAIYQLQRDELMYDLQTVAERLQSLFMSVNLNDKKRSVDRFLHYFEQLKMHSLRLKQQLNAAGNSEKLSEELDNLDTEIHCDKTLSNEHGEIGRLIHFVI